MHWCVLGLALLLTVVLMPLASRGLANVRLLDEPTDRSLHSLAAPRGAGLLLIIIFVASIFVIRPTIWVLWLLPIGFGVVGAIDDWRRQAPLTRLGFQFAIAVVGSLGLVGNFGADVFWALLVIVFLVAIVNAVNFMDGANGMVALSAAILGITYAVLFLRIGDSPMIVYSLVLTALMLGFLPWNMPRARIFLGDSGSYLVGGILGAMVAYLALSGAVLAALFPLATYGFDTSWTLWKRLRGHRPVLEPHREHVYQRLVLMGWAHWQASALTAAFTAMSGALAIVVLDQSWPTTALLTGLVLLVNSVYLLIPSLWTWNVLRGNRNADNS